MLVSHATRRVSPTTGFQATLSNQTFSSLPLKDVPLLKEFRQPDCKLVRLPRRLASVWEFATMLFTWPGQWWSGGWCAILRQAGGYSCSPLIGCLFFTDTRVLLWETQSSGILILFACATIILMTYIVYFKFCLRLQASRVRSICTKPSRVLVADRNSVCWLDKMLFAFLHHQRVRQCMS